jgi:hypothetical protein
MPLVEDVVSEVDVASDGEVDDEMTTYYHGTSIWSADIILKSGINLKNGSGKQAFSNADGFYVTNRLNSAINCATKLTARYILLIFYIFQEVPILLVLTYPESKINL